MVVVGGPEPIGKTPASSSKNLCCGGACGWVGVLMTMTMTMTL